MNCAQEEIQLSRIEVVHLEHILLHQTTQLPLNTGTAFAEGLDRVDLLMYYGSRMVWGGRKGG